MYVVVSLQIAISKVFYLIHSWGSLEVQLKTSKASQSETPKVNPNNQGYIL